MGENRASGESDRIDRDRRRALAQLGLWGGVAYVAPVLLTLSAARADEGGGSGGEGDHDGPGGASGDDDRGGDSAARGGPGIPPEAP